MFCCTVRRRMVVCRCANDVNALRVRAAWRTFSHIWHMNRRRQGTVCPAAWTNDDGANDADVNNSDGWRRRRQLQPQLVLASLIVSLDCESAADLRGQWARSWRQPVRLVVDPADVVGLVAVVLVVVVVGHWRVLDGGPGGRRRQPAREMCGTVGDDGAYSDRRWADRSPGMCRTLDCCWSPVIWPVVVHLHAIMLTPRMSPTSWQRPAMRWNFVVFFFKLFMFFGWTNFISQNTHLE